MALPLDLDKAFILAGLIQMSGEEFRRAVALRQIGRGSCGEFQAYMRAGIAKLDLELMSFTQAGNAGAIVERKVTQIERPRNRAADVELIQGHIPRKIGIRVPDDAAAAIDAEGRTKRVIDVNRHGAFGNPCPKPHGFNPVAAAFWPGMKCIVGIGGDEHAASRNMLVFGLG